MKYFITQFIIFMSVVALLPACKDSESSIDLPQGKVQLTIRVAPKPTSINDDGWKLNQLFAFIYETEKGTVEIAQGYVSEVNKGDNSAVVTAVLDAPKDGTLVKVGYPFRMYESWARGFNLESFSQQHGLFDDANNGIIGNLDIAMASTVIYVDGQRARAKEEVDMKNLVSIVKIHLNLDNETIPANDNIEFHRIIICDGRVCYQITPANAKPSFTADNDIYVAMLPYVGDVDIMATTTASDGNSVSFSSTIPVNINSVERLTINKPETANLKVGNISYPSIGYLYDGMTLERVHPGLLTIAPDATVTLRNVSNFGDNASITCLGDATIRLEGDNSINMVGIPAIKNAALQAGPLGSTLTIEGTGSLTVTSLQGAGIGSAAGGSCGTIHIKSGSIEAKGGHVSDISGAAGIGLGSLGGQCDGIIIDGGINQITATSGGYGAAPIGNCGKEGEAYGEVGRIVIDGTTEWLSGQAMPHLKWNSTETTWKLSKR